MFKAIIIIKIVDNNGMEFFEGDRVRVLMKPKDSNRPDRAEEYIGFVNRIETDYFELNDGYDFRKIVIGKIDRMRLARTGETFANTWNFDD